MRFRNKIGQSPGISQFEIYTYLMPFTVSPWRQLQPFLRVLQTCKHHFFQVLLVHNRVRHTHIDSSNKHHVLTLVFPLKTSPREHVKVKQWDPLKDPQEVDYSGKAEKNASNQPCVKLEMALSAHGNMYFLTIVKMARVTYQVSVIVCSC